MIHPGEILREEFLEPLGMSPGVLARRLGVPRSRIERLANETTSVSIDTALRLSRCFNMSAEFWVNLQKGYDLQKARKTLAKDLNKIKPCPLRWGNS